MNKIKKYDLLIVLILVAIYGIYVFDLNRLILDKNLVLVGGDLSFNIFLIKILNRKKKNIHDTKNIDKNIE